MNFEVLVCPNCHEYFNKDDHIPLIIPTCGHTYCSSCISTMLANCSSDQPFICPDDKMQIPIQPLEISSFPKNLMVLRFVDQRDVAMNSSRQSRIELGTPSNRSAGYSPERNFGGGQENSATLRELVISPKNLSTIRMTLNRQNSSAQNTVDNQNLCKEHGKKLDFLCLNHKCRICANCALVGNHKNHEIKSEEEAIKEIAEKADRIIEVVQGLENTETIMPPEQFNEILSWRMNEKYTELEEEITAKFKDYIAMIEAKKEKVLNEAKSRLSTMEEHLQILNEYPDNFKASIDLWKQHSKGLLYIICEKADKGEIIYELLDDKFSNKPDLIKEGEELVKEINRYTAIPMETLEKELSKICPVFNENFSVQVESLCKLSKHQLKSFNDFENKKKMPEPEASPAVGSERMESLNSRIRMSIEKKFTNDNNLLNFEWKEFNPTENMRFDSRRSTFGNSNFVSEPVPNFDNKFFNQSMLPDILETPEASYKNSFLSTFSEITPTKNFKIDLGKLPQKEYAVPVTSSRSPRETVSTNTTNSGNARTRKSSVSPLGRTKFKKKLKVPMKYESIIEGIEMNKIESADLFDAELGDQGVAQLAEYLKNNTALRTLKLVKNKITDEGVIALVNALAVNNTLENLHLSQNMLTDKAVDYFLELFKFKPTLRTIFFNRNLINLRNVKNKVKEISEMGVNVSL